MNAHVLAVLIMSWLIGSAIAGLLLWHGAGPRLVYPIFMGVGLLTGSAYDWVYGIGGSTAGWLMLVVCPLLWLQGAWLVTHLPRWIANGRAQYSPGNKRKVEG